MIRLKPCPFCLAEELFIPTVEEENHYVGSIYCLSCGAIGPESDTAKEGIRKWNTRTGDKK